MNSFNQFVKELKSMEGLERFNWYVLKPIALMILILVVAFMQDRPTPTRGAVAPLFFAQSKAAFQNLAWLLISNLVNANAEDRKNYLNAQDRKTKQDAMHWRLAKMLARS